MTLPTPVPCDCLNYCGDDAWLLDGRATPCQHAIERDRKLAEARECAELQKQIAYSTARSDIECELLCVAHEPVSSGGYISWFDTTPGPHLTLAADGEHITQALRYLTLSKLLEAHPTRPGVVRVLDLPEA